MSLPKVLLSLLLLAPLMVKANHAAAHHAILQRRIEVKAPPGSGSAAPLLDSNGSPAGGKMPPGSGQTPQGSITITVDPARNKKVQFGAGVVLESGINGGTEGGLYAELLANRDFSHPGGASGLLDWSASGPGTKLSLAREGSNNVAVVSCAGSNACGVSNKGYNGKLGFQPSPHNVYFSVRSRGKPGRRTFKAGLYSKAGATVLIENQATVNVGQEWQRQLIQLTPATSQAEQAASKPADSSFVLQCIDCGSEGFELRTVSLFGKVWGNLPIRYDLGQALAALKPAYLRIGGGNDLEGPDFKNFWNWTQTIGPIEERQGRMGSWGVYETNGLGLMELLELTEKLGAQPVLSLYAGFSTGQVASASDMPEFSQLALNMLHFCLDETGEWAQRRAKLGQTKPYNITLVEIGNEDFMPKAKGSYSYRYKTIADAVSKEFPKLEILASTEVEGAKAIDVHFYGVETDFINLYPKPNLAGPGRDVYVMEYAVRGGADFPTLGGSLAEGVGLLAMELNGDIIKGAGYAPLLQNMDLPKPEWTPNLIQFDSNRVGLSTSYYVIQGFGLHRLGSVFETKASVDARVSKLYHSVGASLNGESTYIKLINTDATAKTVLIENLGSAKPSSVWQMQGSQPNQMNELGAPKVVATSPAVAEVVQNQNGKLLIKVPAFSFTALTLGAASAEPSKDPGTLTTSLK